MWARLSHCGRLDLRQRWESPEQAAQEHVWRTDWHCQECDSSDFELESLEEEPPEIPDAFLHA